MNKKIIIMLGILAMVGSTQIVWAEKGASAQAQEHASENAIFNRVGDWFATVGKSKEEKNKILAERKAKRAKEKAEKKAKKMKKEAEGKAKEMKSKMMKKEAEGKAKDMKSKMMKDK